MNWFKSCFEGTARIPPSDVMFSTRWTSTDKVSSGSTDSWSPDELKFKHKETLNLSIYPN